MAELTLPESVVAVSTLPESMAAELTLSESMAAQSMLSESMAAQSTLSESMAAQSTLSESMAAQSTLSQSMAAQSTLSESMAALMWPAIAAPITAELIAAMARPPSVPRRRPRITTTAPHADMLPIRRAIEIHAKAFGVAADDGPAQNLVSAQRRTRRLVSTGIGCRSVSGSDEKQMQV
ncbi:MAG: hypothetical protein ACLP19_16845 [Xanthobacteraceae bacterium]